MKRAARWTTIGGLALLGLLGTRGDPAPTPAASVALLSGPAEAVGWVTSIAPETPAPLAGAAVAVDATIYRPRERMVRLTDPMELGDLARELGLTVQRRPGRSGLALVEGPPEALQALADDPRVAYAQPHARLYGSTDGVTGAQLVASAVGSTAAADLQWHLSPLELPGAPGSYADFTVAILDSGVAYETAAHGGKAFTRAPGLANNPIRSPWNFVGDDPHANDDNQHGTHVASIIGASGWTRGVTPGVGLMPVKILGSDNAGTELALIEGIHHAVDHGADVINMSVSFPEGYQPSLALLDAIEAAHDADIVMLAAVGNHGANQVSWPAASPLVIAVTSSRLADASGAWSSVLPGTSYANASSRVDIAAPGGTLDTDIDANGIPDGIVAEGIHPGNPAQVGVWVMAGTSQATAVASGLAVEKLRRGVPPREVRFHLQATSDWGGPGVGAGICNLGGLEPLLPDLDYRVALAPHLEPTSDGVVPAAKVTILLDGAATPLSRDFQVEGQFFGAGQSARSVCTVPAGGVSCELRGTSVATTDPSTLDAAWQLEVQGLWVPGTNQSYRPTSAITVTEALQTAVGALRSDPQTQDAMILWSFDDTVDPELGTVAASYVAVNTDLSRAAMPGALIVTPHLMHTLAQSTSLDVQAGAYTLDVELLTLDGSGLTSIPFGITDLRLAVLDGSGLTSLPLGLHIGDMHGDGDIVVSLDGSGLTSLPLGLIGTPIGDQLDEGGWTNGGYSASSALGSSSLMGISAGFAEEL